MKYVSDNSLRRIIQKLKSMINLKADKNHGHKYAGSATDGGSAISADKLTTARTIRLTGEGESYPVKFDGSGDLDIPITKIADTAITWGNEPTIDSLPVATSAMISSLRANVFAFCNSDGVTIEDSFDNGKTWQASKALKKDITMLFSGIVSGGIGVGGTGAPVSTNSQTRIILDGKSMGIYCRLRRLCIFLSTQGAKVYVKVEVINNRDFSAKEIGTFRLEGWSGWNSIPLNEMFGGVRGETSIRLTFFTTQINEAYGMPIILNIYALSQTVWTSNSEMAKNDHLYSYDYQQNAIFPNNVKATTLSFEDFKNTHQTVQSDKILTVTSSGTICYRTPSEILSDISGASKSDMDTAKGNITALQKNKADTADIGILQSDFRDLSQRVDSMSSVVSQHETDISKIKTDITISTTTINKFKALGFK